MSFTPVWYHRLRYMLTPQLDLYQNIGKHIGSIRGLRLLDYGCGNGFGTVQLCGHDRVVTGVDCDGSAIEFADSCLSQFAEFRHENWAEKGVFPDVRFFDAVTCIEVIEHMNGDEVYSLLTKLKESSSEHAQFFISTLNHNSQYRKNEGHIGKWCVAEFRGYIGGFFSDVKIFDYTLQNELDDESSITPMVAVCRK